MVGIWGFRAGGLGLEEFGVWDFGVESLIVSRHGMLVLYY